MAPAPDELLRPCDLAVLLLASGELSPRQRARDQQADHTGGSLKRRVLSQLIIRDPDAIDLEMALLDIVDEIGPPTGPTRAVALSFLDDWRVALTTPGWVEHLLDDARTAGQCRSEESPRRRR